MARAKGSGNVLTVGAGIGGVSLAYFLAERGVTDASVVQREERPGYHATGRIAATLVELDPIPVLQKIKIRRSTQSLTL